MKMKEMADLRALLEGAPQTISDRNTILATTQNSLCSTP